MSNGLRITPTVDQARVFECPTCKETISTSVSQCPFCSASIDPGAAQAAADFMSRLNQACSDASYLRIVAGMMLFFLGLLLVSGFGIPFVGTVGTFGMWFLLIAVPAMAIRWRSRFGSIQSDDSDFQNAKRAVKIAVWIWVPFFVLFLGVPMAGLVRVIFR